MLPLLVQQMRAAAATWPLFQQVGIFLLVCQEAVQDRMAQFPLMVTSESGALLMLGALTVMLQSGKKQLPGML